MDENSDDRQHSYPNHNYRSGYQGPIHLHPSLERRIASGAAKMACSAHALRLAQQAKDQAISSAAASASANAVEVSRIERSLAGSEAITEEETTQETEIEKWKRSNDAARLRADLNAAQRHGPEIGGQALETGGVRERIVSRMQAESGGREMGVMPPAMAVEMLDSQRDSDKEEMEADAVWPAKNKKEGKRDAPAREERKAERQRSSKMHASGLDSADESRPSPARTPLPPSRAASMSTQVGPDSDATLSAATTSAWGAGLSPVSPPGEVPRALYDRKDISNGERYLKKVIQDREETTKRLLDHSKEVVVTNLGGLELLGVVFRTLNASALRESRREECEDLLREIASRGGMLGEDRREKASKMAATMIEDYQKETKALEERLVELSRASQLASLENVRGGSGDHLNHIKWATEQAAESGRGRPSSGAVLDPSLMYERYLPQSASGMASATTSTLEGVGPALPLTGGASAYWSRPNPGTVCVPASTLRGLGPAQPVTGRPYISLPHPVSGTASATPSTLRGVGPRLPLSGPSHGCPPTSARTMQDILDSVQGGEMDGLLNFTHEDTNDNPLPIYALPPALPNADRFLNSSLLRQQANDRDSTERLSLEREVLASIATMAGNSINEAQDNEDAQAERSPVADHPAFSAAMNDGRTMAQVLGEDYAKEMRQRTIREREERILKRARQISAQHAPLYAISSRVEITRVASHGGDGNDTLCTQGTSLENLRPLELNEVRRQRLDDLHDDENQAGSRSDALPDLSNTPRNPYSEDWTKPRPWLTADRPRPGPPSRLHAAFLAENQRASSTARISQEKTNEEGKGVDSAENEVISSIIADVAKPCCSPGILNAAGARKCTTFRSLDHESARCNGCDRTNGSVLDRCETCTGQRKRGCMESDRVHNGRGIDWMSGGTNHEGPRSMAVKPVSYAELKREKDAGETPAKDAMATIDGSLREAEDLLKSALSNITGRKVTLTLSRKPLAKSSTAETSRPPPSTLASSALVAEGTASETSAAGDRAKKAKEKKTEDAVLERELDQKFHLAYEEAFQESLSMAATQEERDEIFRSAQLHDEKVAVAKRLRVKLAEEFKRKRGESDEAAEEGEGRPSPTGDRASETLREMDGCLEDMCSRALQPTYISASQTSEAQSRYDTKASEHDDEEQGLPGMTDQEMAEKIIALKRLQKKFKHGRLETDESENEQREENSEAAKVQERFYEDCCREKSEGARSSARQSKYILAWQRHSGRSGTVEAPRSPLHSDSTLVSQAKAEASALRAAVNNAGSSSRKGHKKGSLEERMYQGKLAAAKGSVKASRQYPRASDSISSSLLSDLQPSNRFPTMFLLSLDADMINLAGAFEQDPGVWNLTRSQFFELLEKTFPDLWERWQEYEADPLYIDDTGIRRRSSEVEKEGPGIEKTLKERVEERSKRYEDGMRKAMDRSVHHRGAVKGKGKEREPNLSIVTSRTMTDIELQMERAKAFNEGNIGAFKDMEMARKKGFEQVVRSVIGPQSSSVGGRSGGEGNKSSGEWWKHIMKKVAENDSLGTQAKNAPIAFELELAEDKPYEREEGPLSHDPYRFWVLVQFDSSASDLPQNFPWRSDGLMCELFEIMSPTTLPSLLSSLEAKMKKELEAMKVSEGNPAAAAAGVAGLAWLADHKISGLSVLWNWRREYSPSNLGSAAMPFVRTPSLSTQVTERNVNSALWMMSEERGHLLLVHTAKREVAGKDDSKAGKRGDSEREIY